MKKGLILTIILSMTICCLSYGQFSFGASPGIGLNSTYFGYKVNNKFVPHLGFQFLNASLKYEQNGQRFDGNLNEIVPFTESDELSGNLFIPSIGLKYFIKEQNKLRAYLSLNLSKPIGSAKLINDGVEDIESTEDITNINIWGGELGFGVEFFFDENFSFGGEFGLRYIHLKYIDSYDRDIFNPETGGIRTVTIEDSVKSNASPTFSKISLNYYFSNQTKNSESAN